MEVGKMRAFGFYLADLAINTARGERPPVPEPENDPGVWTERRAAAWRAWRLEGERELAGVRALRAVRVRVSRPHRLGPWLPLILGRIG
jgi:hypothetical protein